MLLTEETCPNCGRNIFDVYYCEEWGKALCEECIDEEEEQWA